MNFPVDILQPDLHSAMQTRQALFISAATGSGKSTRVPLMLSECKLSDGAVWVTQPRRLACQLLARFVAKTQNVALGQEIGYWTRFDKQCQVDTSLIYMTEGIVCRQLLSNPMLNGVSVVVVDEWHERTLEGDFLVAWCRYLMRVREDFKLVFMSATSDTEAFCSEDDIQVLHAEGRSFPVDIHYASKPDVKPDWQRAVEAVKQAVLWHDTGDILVFLPTVFDIEKAQQELSDLVGVNVCPLHSRLSADKQIAATSGHGIRKIVLSTNIAETSITLPRVKIVIDTGTSRQRHVNIEQGVSSLAIKPISQASAQQRSGRAGRISEGVCYRLWTRKQHAQREGFDKPAWHTDDVLSMVLLAHAIEAVPLELPWVELPELSRFNHAVQKLQLLDALDKQNKITPTGTEIVRVPIAPELARLIVVASRKGIRDWACYAAVWAESGARAEAAVELPSDPRGDLIPTLRQWMQGKGIDVASKKQVQQLLRIALSEKGCNAMVTHPDAGQYLGDAIAEVFPSHCGIRLDDSRADVLLADKLTGQFVAPVVGHWCGPCVSLRRQLIQHKHEQKLQLQGVVSLSVEESQCESEEELIWSETNQSVQLQTTLTRWNLPIRRYAIACPAKYQGRASEILAKQMAAGVCESKDFAACQTWLMRLEMLAHYFPERYHAYDLEDLEVLRLEFCTKETTAKALRNKKWLPILQGACDWQVAQDMPKLLPPKISFSYQTKQGDTRQTSVSLRYPDDMQGPVIAALKLQHAMTLTSHPTIMEGRLPLTLELLGPNGRPVQLTQNILDFWRGSYVQIRKDLRGRYPKHAWPEAQELPLKA